MAVKANATTTLSFMVDVKAVYHYYKLQASTASAPSVPTSFPPTGWTDSEPTYTEGSTNTLYTVDCNVFTNDTFAYSAVSKSTSYEAAKAAYNKAVNAQNTADDAAKTATNFMQFVDGEGLYVGNNQTGTWDGVRTRMDTDSFDVIDQNGNTLASYGTEMSITPNNTSGYKITMGNAVTIGTRYPGSTEGLGSIVIGYNGSATNSYSHAEGAKTEASGSGSHSEGWETTASGDYSHAEGEKTEASGGGSHAEGYETTASGLYSHAEGWCTTASGTYSHASGMFTKATALGQFVIGQFNDTSDDALFIIGNGTSGKDSNAFEVGENGNVLVYGDIRAYGNIYYNISVCNSAYDIDTMITTGKYYCGTYVANKPAEPGNASGSNGWLEVMQYVDKYDQVNPDKYVHQRYSTCNGDVYERNCDDDGTWQKWRVVFYHYEMTATTAETLLLDFVSDYPFTINIGACNSSNVPVAAYSYTAFNNNSDKTSKINANTAALNSTYGTITAAASGITIKSTASYKLYITVTQ